MTIRSPRWLEDGWTTTASQASANIWSVPSGTLHNASSPIFDVNMPAPGATDSGIPAAGAAPAITEVFTGQASTLADLTAIRGPDGAAAFGPSNPFDATPAEVRAAVAANNLGVTGAGITVGVLSDSFNDRGGAAHDEADGALPSAADVDVLKDLGSGGTDEGRAMMQIVHDIAPGANLDFYTADVSEQDFANGILSLAAAGCKVICDDVTYFDEPFFQTGVVANAIQTVEQEGVIFVTAAGNNAENGYQAAWDPIAIAAFDGTVLHDAQNFGGGSPVETVTLGGGANANTVPIVFEWNQPYGSVTSDLEVLVFSGGELLGTVTNSDSGEPNNPFIAFGLSSGFTYQIAVENLSGPDPGEIGEMAESDGLPITLNVANAGTVQGHHMSTDAITVGAVDAGDTRAFGGSLQNESYSSSGLGTQLWFNFNGSSVANGPIDLSPVALSGVDDIGTSVSGGLSDFFGTSAATPSVAAVVALMLQENPDLTFAQIEQILEQTATSFGNSQVAGSGLVDAAQAVQIAGQIGNDIVAWADGVSGDFAVAGNWSPAIVPGPSNNVAIVASGTYTVTSSASESVKSLTIASGIILDVTGGTFTVTDSGQSSAISATVLAGSGATFVLDGSASNAGTLQAIGGIIDIDGTLSGSGAVDVGDDGMLDLLGGSIAGNVAFTGTNAELVLHDEGIGGQILGAVATDSIDAAFVSFAAGEQAVWQQTGNSGGTLSLYSDGADLGSFNLAGQYVSDEFNVSADAQNNALITVVTPVTRHVVDDDFTGDGISDVLWRNNGDDSLATWLMNGSAISSSSYVTYQGNAIAPDASWSVAGTGDFNGDGDADILWRQSTTGALVDWSMNGSVIEAGADVTYQGNMVTPDSSWSVAGIGDFNGDGDADILWRQSTTGALVDWSMNGSVIAGDAYLTYQGNMIAPDSSWSVAGIGDFNGDGKADILWRQSTTGSLAMWQMNGSAISSSANVTSGGIAITPDSTWSVVGIGDFNDDGDSDILWRQSTTGSLAIWLMNGSTITSSANVTSGGSAVMPDSTWNIVEVGDFNGSNQAGILWQQSTTGTLAEWQMNGAQIVSSQIVTSGGTPVAPASSWQVQTGPTDFT